ncbi:MAG: glycerophosphodiester phosphodiesterase family protein [Planctomycetota bacterium]
MTRILRVGLILVAWTAAWVPLTRAMPMDDRDPPRQQRIELPERLLVIGHRGASGYRPEHTLEAYALAITQGADFIEPDLVATKDGVLIARHENLLNGTTNIVEMVAAGKLEDRKATKTLDGVVVEDGYWSEDYTWAEIQTLRAKERIPRRRPDNTAFDGLFQVPSLQQIIELVKTFEKEQGVRIGIYPETKHPTYFAEEGRFHDGGKIGVHLGRTLVQTLVREAFTDPRRVYIQSFEVANLIELQTTIMPAFKVDLPLVQLLGDTDDLYLQPGSSFSRPYDFIYYGNRDEAERRRIYGKLVDVVDITPTTGYGALTTKAALDHIATHYAEALGPWKNSFLRRAPIDPKVDANGDGDAKIGTRLTGEVRPFLRHALDAGLEVHPYTLRAEEAYLTLRKDGEPQNVVEEGVQLFELGVTGLFTDQPDLGLLSRTYFLDRSIQDPTGD